MVPKDPAMLLSMKLRDCGKDLEGICEELDVSREEMEARLAGIDYHYSAERNQFV